MSGSLDNSGLIRNALLLTDPDLNRLIDGQISWWNSIRQRGARVHKYRNYERGDHDANITDQMRAMLRLKQDDAQLNDFNDNYMATVIDKMVSRIVVSEVLTGDKGVDTGWLKDMLKDQDFKATQSMWWRSAVRDGDAFVMVDLDSGNWTTEPAFDGYSGMVAIIDIKTRKPIWGCKMWAETDVLDKPTVSGQLQGSTVRTMMHLIVYQPGKVSYWTGLEGTMQVTAENPDTIGTVGHDPYYLPDDPKGGPVGQPSEGGNVVLIPGRTDDSGSMIAVGGRFVRRSMDWSNVKEMPPGLGDTLPFVAFANKRDSFTRYGDSEIRVAIPLQDVLNRTLYSMVMASEFAAFGVNWSIGLEIDPAGIVPGGIINLVLKDSSGKVITDFTPEQIAFIQAAKVGQFPATNIQQYIQQIQMIVEEIGQATQTPIRPAGLQGQISAPALLQLESGLISKVIRFQEQNTDALKELVTLTSRIQRIFHPEKGAPSIDTVDIAWKSAEQRDAQAEITNLYTMKQQTGNLWSDDFYRRKIGALLGMSKEDIEREGKEAEKQKEEAQEQMINQFNARGAGGGFGGQAGAAKGAPNPPVVKQAMPGTKAKQ